MAPITIELDSATDVPAVQKENLTVAASGDWASGIQVVSREKEKVEFRDETGGQARNYFFNIPRNLSGLASLPADESKFPATVWLRRILTEGIQSVVLDPKELRKPSPPPRHGVQRFDGSSLARLVAQLRQENPQRFRQWQEHLRTSLPDLRDVTTVPQPADRTRYILARYENGVEVPSWMLSDGTLRLFALTVLAYLPGAPEIYLIEEPENGIHPTAIGTVFQSLSSVYEGQVFIATHSPVLLGLAQADQILCFSKNSEGETEILRGDQHPVLKEWKGEVSLSDLFAGGVLG
jgi:hypothetical protein